MEKHTIILSTAKVIIPENVTIEFVSNLITNSITMIDYIGPEIDNQEDYVSAEIKKASDQITYIMFHFDTIEDLGYESLNDEDIRHLIGDLLQESEDMEVRAGEKDITVYL